MSDAAFKNAKTESELLSKLTPSGPERGGFILSDGRLYELANVADKPDMGFFPEITDELLTKLDDCAGTWHTHPGSTANLSTEDRNTFLQWPTFQHAIVGTDGVRWYAVDKGAVLNA